MSAVDALTATVLEYTRTLEGMVADGKAPTDWGPLAQFVAVDVFERVGTFMEVQNWQQYTDMLNGWVSSVDKFETVVRRISERPPLVFFEIEERHFRAGEVHVVNSMTVFDFDDEGKIRHLDVYLQQGRAT